MLFYLLSHEELICTLKRLGYPFTKELILRNIRYYLQRTSHGSTISLVIYSFIIYPFDPEEGWKLYKQFILSDICDIQGGTVSEGIHIVPMSASINMLLFQLCGIDITQDVIKFNPHLPKEVKFLLFRFYYRRTWLKVYINQKLIEITIDDTINKKEKVTIQLKNNIYDLLPQSTIQVSIYYLKKNFNFY